jgi:hypothetical protein
MLKATYPFFAEHEARAKGEEGVKAAVVKANDRFGTVMMTDDLVPGASGIDDDETAGGDDPAGQGGKQHHAPVR